MNLEQLKRDVGYRVKLVPQACHLDAAGDALPSQDEDWTIMTVTDDYIEISAASGHLYRLGKDHIHRFTSDVQRSADGLKHGFLTLHVQLFVEGADVRAVPNFQPGVPVAPPVNRALRARAFFTPELERVFRRQVQVLGRVVPNYNYSYTEKGPCPGDTWESLKPSQPELYPQASVLQDLSATDAELLSEFYASVREVGDILASWIATAQPLTDYNSWNVLMHKVQHSLRRGELAIKRFCPDRHYDATSPASGTLLFRSERALSSGDGARAAFMARHASSAHARAPNPLGRRK